MATDGMFGTDGTINVDSGQTREEQPTAQLRFVERTMPIHPADTVEVARKVRILQQMWQIVGFDSRGRDPYFWYEWRDVPLELEG